ncbi:protein phosphatase 2C domain-containing protein [Streptomyces europaeiscabiei]|uniref:protein phosphatase 2C domain-containing protein n=1 Tax=Streptomyces europaeiscabiei TaxID=146819 RepID=UPI002E113E22|nr:protein phosphatase 2C domain-containing protein [Streptomyces europaeiscabiei]
MSQQGERPTGHEDDWWRQLYDDTNGDTGPSVAADSLDDRFASAADTVGKPPTTSTTPADPASGPGVPGVPGVPGETHPASAPGASTPATPASAPRTSRASGPPGTWGAVPGTSGAWAAVPGTSPARGASRGGSDRRPGGSGGSGGGPNTTSGPRAVPQTSDPAPSTPGPLSDRVPSQGPPGGPRGWEGRSDDGSGGRDGPGRQRGPGDPGDPGDPGGPAGRDGQAGRNERGDRPDYPPVPPSAPSPTPFTAPVSPPVPVSPPAPTSPPVPVSPPDRTRLPSNRIPPLAPATDPLRRSGLVPQPAPWEPPPVQPSGPVTFPPGPTPQGFLATAPWRRAPAQRTAGDVPAVGPPAGAVPAHGGSHPDDASPGGTPPQDAVRGGTPSPSSPMASSSPRSAAEPSDARPPTHVDLPTLQAQEVTLVTGTQRVRVEYVGSGPPTYDAEPTTLPPADPEDLGDLVADTVLDGARYGACTLRAASLRGDSARYRGEPRRDALLTARFGLGEQALVLVAMATGARATPGAHRAAAEACRWIGRAVGLSHARLVEDIRAARRGDLKSGLHRLTDRSLGRLRASAVEQGLDPEEYTASLRCLLIPADPRCRTRVFFGVGAGGLFRLRDGDWQDIEPRVADTAGAPVLGFGSLPHETPDGDRLTMDLGITTPPSPYEPASAPPREPFRFRASVAREEDVLLLCTGGLAEPLRGEAPLAEHLAARWGAAEPPGLAAFLADAQVRVKGYTDDRTAAAVWEA